MPFDSVCLIWGKVPAIFSLAVRPVDIKLGGTFQIVA